MSYLEIPITALNGQTKVIIPKKDILYARQGDANLPQPTADATLGTTVTLFLSTPAGTFDTLTLTHTILSAAVLAAGYNVADVINETLASNPGGIVAKVGGIPATLSATFQALSFVQFSAPVLA